MLRKAKRALDQAAAVPHPGRFFARLTAWRVLTAAGRGATVTSRRYGVRWWCPPEWRGSAKLSYALRDEYERELVHLDRWVSRGDVVVDAGAHYGAYAVPLGRLVGDEGLVLAVEPSSHARTVLARSLELNGLQNVEVLPLGLSESATTGVLRVHADRSRASLALAGDDAVASEDVKLARLDDVVPAGGE
jgi:FkbM family methyltransferase